MSLQKFSNIYVTFTCSTVFKLIHLWYWLKVLNQEDQPTYFSPLMFKPLLNYHLAH